MLGFAGKQARNHTKVLPGAMRPARHCQLVTAAVDLYQIS